MKTVRFLSFNIHGGRSRDGLRDLARVNNLLERFDIDVAVFQEMETRLSRGGTARDVDILAGASRAYRFAAPSMAEGAGWFGNLLVSRYPIIEARIHNLETKPRYEPRNALDATIELPAGNVRIVGTHLSLSPFERRSEARKLLELMAAVEEEENNPLFLMGDINEWQYPSRLLRFLDGAMNPVPCRATFPAAFPIFRLDRVWHDAPGWRVAAHRLTDPDVAMLSDHLPVLIEASPRPIGFRLHAVSAWDDEDPEFQTDLRRGNA